MITDAQADISNIQRRSLLDLTLIETILAIQRL